MTLIDKTYVVAGAGGRIGRKLVSALLEREANVVAVEAERQAIEELVRSFGEHRRFLATAGDITQATAIQAAFSRGVERFGPLDGAVNTAYPRNEHYGRKFFDVTFGDFCENISVHLGGYFLFLQQCARYAQGSGRSFSLVNISSIYGVMAPRFDIYVGEDVTMPVEYAAIKAGIQHLTRYATAYMKGTQFRANCISPGGIFAGQAPGLVARYNSYCRSKGMLDPRDITGTIAYLLSDDSEFVCGQNIVVDDGFSTG